MHKKTRSKAIITAADSGVKSDDFQAKFGLWPVMISNSMLPDYYAILGISPDADTAAIKAAFRRLAKQFHPDINPAEDGQRFKVIHAAADILSDPARREQYDRARRTQSEAPRRMPPPEQTLVYQDVLRCIQVCRQSGAKQLHLVLGRLSFVPEELYRLTHLEDLVIQGDALTELPRPIARLSGLKRLYLQTRRLTILPEELSYLPCLEVLSLRCDILEYFPPVLTYLPWLQHLSLSARLSQDLPPEIGFLHSLESLELHCHLRELPAHIWRLAHLRRLDLSHNQLTTLPPEIGLLARLEWLNVSHNHLVELPRHIANLLNLRRLELAANLLDSLPLELGKIDWTTGDRVLDVSGNPLADFAGIPPEQIGRILNEEWAWTAPLEWLWKRATRPFRRRSG